MIISNPEGEMNELETAQANLEIERLWDALTPRVKGRTVLMVGCGTGIGKTAMILELARQHNIEIVEVGEIQRDEALPDIKELALELTPMLPPMMSKGRNGKWYEKFTKRRKDKQ
jgi:2-phosphoglycerate kinase